MPQPFVVAFAEAMLPRVNVTLSFRIRPYGDFSTEEILGDITAQYVPLIERGSDTEFVFQDSTLLSEILSDTVPAVVINY